VPRDAEPAPGAVAFARSLGPVAAALDLGCGDGRLTGALRADRVVAADVSAVALERARERLGPAAELLELEPDAPLPLGDGEFDLVLLADALEHVRDVQLLLSEVRRVLKPGGELALTTPSVTRIGVALRGLEPPLSPHLRFLSKRSLRRLLDDLGFDVRSLERSGRVLYARATR
jgi:SAM-dependent methyltransferase